MISLKVTRVLPPCEMNSRSLFAEKITGVLEDFPVHRNGQTVEVTFFLHVSEKVQLSGEG